MGRCSTLTVGAGLLTALVSLTANAGNKEHPRTPVVWPEAPCIRTVDRSVDPVFEFSYTIPHEDTLLSVDEFDDSRTHQFVGFCRQWPPGRPPPRYISTYDLERAIMGGFEEAEELDDPEATLETSVEWADCWTRITADDARRPITFAAAAEPVVWDTAGLPAGTWQIAGYTWEPQYNLWSRAPWVVRVLDDPQAPAQAAASMADTADFLGFDESLDISLCVDASAGSTVTLEWSSAASDPAVWDAVTSAELVDEGAQSLELPFVPPEPSWGETLLLRATVEPSDALPYAAHALATLIVFAPPSGDGDGDGDGGGDGDGDPDPGETDSGDEGSTGDRPADPGSSSTGRCSLDPERGNLPMLVVVLGILALRRRRVNFASNLEDPT